MLHGETGFGPRGPGAATVDGPLNTKPMTVKAASRDRAKLAALMRPKRRGAPANSGTVRGGIADRPRRLQTMINPPSNSVGRNASSASPATIARQVGIRHVDRELVVADGLNDGR